MIDILSMRYLLMKKKKQHTIPRCYLENFIDGKGNLHVLDLKEKKIFTTKPSKVLRDNHFYTIKFPKGGGSLVVENTLEKIESEYASIFHHKIKERKPLEIEKRALVSIFVAAMLFRTKAFRSNLKSFFKETTEYIEKLENLSENDKARLASIPSLSSSRSSISGEDFKKMARDVRTFHSYSIIEILPEASIIIFNMKWTLLVSEEIDEYFITSDNPCVLVNVPAIKKYGPRAIGSSPGLLQDDVDLTLPLSSKIALLAGWKLKNEVYASVPKKFVKEINNRVAMHAQEKLIACSSDKLEDLLKN